MRLAIIDATIGAGAESDEPPWDRYAIALANRPLIVHVALELVEAGFTRAVIVARHDVRRKLEPILSGGQRWSLEVSYVEAPEGGARLAILREAAEALASEPVLLHPGDCLLGSQLTAMHERFRSGDVDAVLPEQMTIAALRSPARRRVADEPVALGLGARALVADLQLPRAEGDDLIAALLASDCRLAVCAAFEPWYYSASTDGLLAGNRIILDRLQPAELTEELRMRNKLSGRISVHSTAYLSDCIVAGPVVIGERAVLEGSSIGPYTAIGAGAVLRGTEIDNSMVLPGAEIHHPGMRLESSIIGERARVTRSFQLPRGIHLRLGPGAEVDFS